MKYTGDSVDAAISKGLADLKVGRNQVEVKILSEGHKGFLGIGKKPAVVDIHVITPNKQVNGNYSDKIENAITDDIKQSEKQVVKSRVKKMHNEVSSSNERDLDEVLYSVGDYLSSIIDDLGIDAEIDVTLTDHIVYYDFDTEKEQEGRLIGHHGKTLNALQVLAQAYLDHQLKQHLKVMLDVGDYRQKRSETLKRLAHSVAKKVVFEKRNVKLAPMPSFERKIIHQALTNVAHISTESFGKGPYRYVEVKYEQE